LTLISFDYNLIRIWRGTIRRSGNSNKSICTFGAAMAIVMITAIAAFGFAGCGASNPDGNSTAGVGTGEGSESSVSGITGESAAAAVSHADPTSSLYEQIINEDSMNEQATLSIPTYVTKIDGTWFIVDCYHNQVLYYDAQTDDSDSASVVDCYHNQVLYYDAQTDDSDSASVDDSESNSEAKKLSDNYENSDDFPQVDLTEWHVLPDDPELPMNQPHTIAGDGNVLLVDDTENNRVLVYTVNDGENSYADDASASAGNRDGDSSSADNDNISKFTLTQKIDNVGTRPHYTKYDETTKTFYTWSSMTGELYCFRDTTGSESVNSAGGKNADNGMGSSGTGEVDATVDATDNAVTWAGTRSVSALNGTYVRSFTIAGDKICFVSGISLTGLAPTVFVCDLETLEVEEQYSIPDEIAGMVQITPLTGTLDESAETDVSNEIDDVNDCTRFTDEALDGPIIVTVSTDLAGSQDAATILVAGSLKDLSEGKWTDIYSDYFVGGGTPYYVNLVDGRYYLTEHRLSDHAIWSFVAETNEADDSVRISDVKALY
jgi:hypothetical protein